MGLSPPMSSDSSLGDYLGKLEAQWAEEDAKRQSESIGLCLKAYKDAERSASVARQRGDAGYAAYSFAIAAETRNDTAQRNYSGNSDSGHESKIKDLYRAAARQAKAAKQQKRHAELRRRKELEKLRATGPIVGPEEVYMPTGNHEIYGIVNESS